ncbi:MULTISPECIES: hypothetical protein [Sphaerospermopsis]|jgi:hypothetical protein|uniref:Uncharacterized protein n=1 Tax=Sphaerospermopsis torques-reginae ITEP-024 TaxID=984208 RepID=A0ABX8WX83_9CYAN|nr:MULTISPECIES: hypothetical protein [Sphaerospermopsis]MBE9054477.1 hypothetical protein [Sphaerospermopsis sp. LEGE 08334]QYX31044.1 hypothetical protein K2F26_19650 [Sphaerospermopsis torques-reginae ITEP-024]
MNTYQTYLTIDNSQQVVISNLPFAVGTKVEIKIHVVDEKRLAAANQLKDLFKEIQSLPSSQEITEEEICEEIDAYRRGE